MTNSSSFILYLLRQSLGTSSERTDFSVLDNTDWNALVDIAFEGGVAAVAVDGLQQRLEVKGYRLERGFANDGSTSLTTGADDDNDNISDGLDSLDSPELEDLKYEWFGSVFQAEEDYGNKFRQASRFASALAEKGVKCFVLKGMSFAQYYRVPEHRECGDCDVYLGDGWQTGNEVGEKLGGRFETGTYKHSRVQIGNLMVENHKFLTSFNGTKQGKKIERLLAQRINEEGGKYIGNSSLFCPNDYFNALFLIKHDQGDFISDGMTLRMIYDWAALLKCCGRRLDWKRLYADLEECRLREFARLMTSLCVDYLGVEVCPGMELCDDKALVEEVMEDTIAGGIHTKGVETFWKKCIRIFRRFLRIWHYRKLATESVPRMIWNNFAFSSYLKRKIEM